MGCTSNSYELEAWRVAKKSNGNAKELISFLTYYQDLGDNAKYAAACFLVSNMPNKHGISSDNLKIYDTDIIKSDSLIKCLDYSFALLSNSPFLKLYDRDIFFEYILPYRISNEPLEYGWKWNFKNVLKISSDDIITAAEEINAQIKLDMSPDSYGDPPQSYSSLMRNGYGKCDDRTMLVAMALRSMGIPSAYEFIPCWGSSNNGHSFVSVVMPDGSIYPLQNTDKMTQDGYLSRKAPKIYRKMYSEQTLNIVSDDSPELFTNMDLLDVTSLHRIGYTDVDLSNAIKDEKPNYYLSVFSPNEWQPVAVSDTKLFKYVGTGTRFNEVERPEAKDLGEGILYLPTFWYNNKSLPAGNPIVVTPKGIHEIICDTSYLTKVELVRKFPLNYRIINFAGLMLGGVLEGANRPDFADAEIVYNISSAPASKMQYVKPESDKRYRYLRYRRLKGTFSIAEIAAKDEYGELIPFKPLLCEALRDEEDVRFIYDGDPLSYYQMGAGFDLWVGMDFGRPVKIARLGFAPRNDDNAVNSTDVYELYYWDNNWKSLGIKKAVADTLFYDNVPSGALLWLRDLTRGKEERPFTYEKSKQVWW